MDPPQVTVVGRLVYLCVGRSRRLHPIGGDDLSSVPLSIIQIKLAQLQVIAATQLKSTARQREAQRAVGPLGVLNIQRLEQVLVREVRNLHLRGTLQHAAQGSWAGGAVTEAPT